MPIHARFLNPFLILALLLGWLPSGLVPGFGGIQKAQAAAGMQPLVAIHVSELTQALERLPAEPPVPSGAGFSGKSWFPTAWHYSDIYEALKIALESDGTPYQLVSDAEIASGALMAGDLPRFPILISLAAEAVADEEIQPLREYVAAGGFLMAGSSAFTRRPDGSPRGDFALAQEMGLRMASPSLQNWVSNAIFTHWTDHRLVSPIPTGTLGWNMLSHADEIVWDTAGAQQLWQTIAQGAEVIATGAGERPLLATHRYGAGRFIYHAIFNPLVGAGGQDAGMYAYSIYRSAIEWAFEAANLPLVRTSPWPYAYDSAFMVRHDFENLLPLVMDIENSARYEHSIGAYGDYYFTTGILRTMRASDRQVFIDSLRRAVSQYQASIGPHNGGYPNPNVKDPGLYEYWHWGPDQFLDRSSFGPAYSQYTSGEAYARDSIRIAFEDIESWLKGTDNGRAGCGADGSCPRIWVSPFFNSGRDASLKMVSELGAVTMGEQKISPFPHWTLSYNPNTPGHRYPSLALPVSDWFIGSHVAQSIESGHTPETIRALVDFYTQKGFLLNLYGHTGSEAGLMKEYASYAVKKPRVWSTNSVGLYDWWVKRSSWKMTPSFTSGAGNATATVQLSGANDPQAAVELSLPFWKNSAADTLEVRLDGRLAGPDDYRLTSYGLKVRVGTAAQTVEGGYTPLDSWADTAWTQAAWPAPAAGAARFTSATTGTPAAGENGPLPAAALSQGAYSPMGAAANRPTAGSWLGLTYKNTPHQPAADYSVEADIRFTDGGPASGGLAGRINPATGQRYAAWVDSAAGLLHLARFSDWTHGSGPGSLADARVPAPGSGWHHLKLVFNGARIQVVYDHAAVPQISIQDAALKSGYAGMAFEAEADSNGPSYDRFSVADLQGLEWFQDDFGGDVVMPDIPSRWPDYRIW